jgi:hypothetical protein
MPKKVKAKPEPKPERRGRGRRQESSTFNGAITDVKLTAEQRQAASEFYQANAAQLIQFRQLCREWGCGR